MYRTLKDLKDLEGKQVLLKVDWNLPIKEGRVADDFRMRASLPAIERLRERKASVILFSHRTPLPHGEDEAPEDSLRPMAEYFSEKFFPIVFVPDSDILALEGKLSGVAPGDVVLIENIRRFKGEERGDPKFGEELARLGNVFVNEAFGEAHRRSASTVELPKYLPSCAGPLFEKEVAELSKAFNPKRPFGLILGGAKFETKLSLVKKYLEKADFVFVGGALANDVFKARGLEVGVSLCSEHSLDLKSLGPHLDKLIVPKDVVVKDQNGTRLLKKPEEVGPGDKILDAGPETLSELGEKIKQAALLVWNGPLGQFEEGFSSGTEDMGRLISFSKAYSIVGGGDTLFSIKHLGLLESFSFVSTGGGAMLQFLADETLPGMEALASSNK